MSTRGTALLLAACTLASLGLVSQASAAEQSAKNLGAKGKATSHAGRLDRGFNGDGRVITALPSYNARNGYPDYRLPFEFAAGRIAMAHARGGKLVIASSKAIVEYLADGRPNPRFGGNGAVPIGRIEGSRFQLSDIAVDSQGRVLIAGTTKPENELGMTGPAVPGPVASVATIRRYLPNGQLDPGFGVEGVLNTNLGAAPPTFEGTAYQDAAVAVLGLAIDQEDRPIVSGSAVAQVGRCAPSGSRYQRAQAIVARLATNGVLDTSFASGGIKEIGGLSWLNLPVATSSGITSVGSKVDPCPRGAGPEAPSVLTRLGGDGSVNTGFSADGFWSRPFTRISDLAIAPAGKLVLLTRTIELSHGKWIESAGEAVRLQRNGSFDRSFGDGGHANAQLPKHSAIGAIAVDQRGRVLLAGTVSHPLRRKQRSQLRFMLIRATTAGEMDRDFGRGGRTTTAFGEQGNARASDVLVDPAGRIAVGGKFAGPKASNAFAIARYLGGK